MLLQFLAEAIFLSVTGGVAGIIMGVAFSAIVAAVAGWPTPISATAILGGFLFSAAVGILFGYDPARKAARLHPIEALRYAQRPRSAGASWPAYGALGAPCQPERR